MVLGSWFFVLGSFYDFDFIFGFILMFLFLFLFLSLSLGSVSVFDFDSGSCLWFLVLSQVLFAPLIQREVRRAEEP
jgi:hypothetical protein